MRLGLNSSTPSLLRRSGWLVFAFFLIKGLVWLGVAGVAGFGIAAGVK